MALRTTIAALTLSCSVFVEAVAIQKRLDNGVAYTPPMGWNSYNAYSCYPNESIIMSNAKALSDLGLADLGYHYVTTDCGWTVPNRTADGTITWNSTIFPNGFPAMGDYIHSLGLGFGVYSDSGIRMCNEPLNSYQVGSLYHETTDADTFTSWGADLLKYDNCYSSADHGYPDADYDPTSSPSSRYNTMRAALNATGRQVLFQICEWGVDFPSTWAPPLGDTWRITNDIIPDWRTVYRQINQVVPSASFAGSQHWPDLDLLEVGNKIFTIPEEQTHFSLWAIEKSPLIISTALDDTMTSIEPDSLAILKNTNVISYNQDSLGVAANITRRWSEEGLDTWAGPLSGNRTIVAFVNWNNNTVTASLDLPDVGLQSAGTAKDIWNNKTVEGILTSYTSTIPAHGTLLIELGETTPAGYYNASSYGKQSGNGTAFSNIYGVTDSSSYALTIQLAAVCSSASTVTVSSPASAQDVVASIAAGASTVTLPIALAAANDNTLTISLSDSSLSVSSLNITPPQGTFYPSTQFTTIGDSAHVNCTAGLCAPVGAKIGYLAPNGSAEITVVAPPSSTSNSSACSSTSKKFIELTYINNDVSLSTSFTTGRNARNITVSVNDGEPVRLEVPLSGRSSELFSPMDGWGDSAMLGILVDGFEETVGAEQKIVVGNVGGDEGVVAYGADFVGLSVLW